ncbi:MAG: hypothetical protein P4L79_10920 [Legionella sp.]|uniref:hypothetical protein n=1 Tax=Legionella sp. TaxID=459 RepID=UPI00284041EE|nr:hypothetical protein [Legionella sp.]
MAPAAQNEVPLPSDYKPAPGTRYYPGTGIRIASPQFTPPPPMSEVEKTDVELAVQRIVDQIKATNSATANT